MKSRTSRDAPTGHKLFKLISISFQPRRWAHIKRSAEMNDNTNVYLILIGVSFVIALVLHFLLKSHLGISIATALIASIGLQVAVYRQLGYLDPFSPIAFVSTSAISFLVAYLIGIPFVRIRNKS